MQSYWWISFRPVLENREWDHYLLFEAGAAGTEESEPGPEQAGETIIKGYFSDAAAYARARDLFADRPGFAEGTAPVEDWDRSWRDRQTPVEVTPSLTVSPPWIAPGTSDHVIRLEAKMAFGTGSHESTRIAALLLESLPVAGRSALDIGTGTGILALYAALLGASPVVGLDIDPVVGGCLRENLRLNPVPEGCRFHVLIGETAALRPEARFDLILCNMIRTELWPFREELRGRLRPGGHFLVSGQRVEDREHFLAWQAQSPFRLEREINLEDWWGFSARVD